MKSDFNQPYHESFLFQLSCLVMAVPRNGRYLMHTNRAQRKGRVGEAVTGLVAWLLSSC